MNPLWEKHRRLSREAGETKYPMAEPAMGGGISMKRRMGWTLLVLALALSLMPGFAPAAEPADRFFDLYAEDAESPSWLGMGIPVLSPGTLLVSGASLPEAGSALTVTDGSGRWEVESALPIQKGLLGLVFFDAEKSAPAAEPLPLQTFYGIPAASSLRVVYINGNGDVLHRTALAATPLSWQEMDCMTLDLSGEAAPGAAVLTDDGELAGMILAEYAEGRNRYVAISAMGIRALLSDPSALVTNLSNPPEGFSASAEKNRVTLDWGGMTLSKEEGKDWYLVIADTSNDYLTYAKIAVEEGGEPTASFLLTPGRTYVAGVVQAEKAPDFLPDQVAVISLPEAERLTAHGFRAEKTCLALYAENAAEGDLPTPLDRVTSADLRSGRAAFYSASTYDIQETEDESLLVVLIAPDNNCYRYASGWTYAPEYMASDVWAVSLKDAGFQQELERKGFPLGEYTMSFFVGGELADSFTFNVEE